MSLVTRRHCLKMTTRKDKSRIHHYMFILITFNGSFTGRDAIKVVFGRTIKGRVEGWRERGLFAGG